MSLVHNSRNRILLTGKKNYGSTYFTSTVSSKRGVG